MENSLYPFSSPSPHPPPPPPKTSLPMLYYGLVVVGTAAIVLAIYNLIIIKWCANHQRQLRNMNRSLEGTSLCRRSLDNASINLGASFKYKKEGEDSLQLGYDNNECQVCLSVFEEEEEVRQLPRCKHSFHAPCIDMWLYSHLDCPLCRAPVEPPVFPRQTAVTTPSEHSRKVLIEQGLLV